MAASSLNDLRTLLKQPAHSTPFVETLVDGYFGTAFGALPKTEIEQLLFTAMIRAKAIDPDGPIYDIARALRIKPDKVKTLLFQHQMRHMEDADIDTKILDTLARAKFSVEGGRLQFGVESPLVRTVIDAKLKQAGIFSDISLSGDILKVPANQLGDFVRVFLTPERAKALEKKLKGIDSEKALLKRLNEFGESVAKDLLKDEAKDGAKRALGGLFKWATDGGAQEFIDTAGHYLESAL